MDNVTNWLLGQRLLERMQDQYAPMQGWTIPRQQSPNTFDEALQSGGPTGFAESKNESSGLRNLSEFSHPSVPSGFQCLAMTSALGVVGLRAFQRTRKRGSGDSDLKDHSRGGIQRGIFGAIPEAPQFRSILMVLLA